MLISAEAVKSCIGWTYSPLPQVGSPSGTLTTTPTGLDSASKVGCKSQSYTSWDCLSRSYVGGVYILTDTAVNVPIPTAQVTEIDLRGDIPTQEELSAMSHAQKILYNTKQKVFARGLGLVSRHQLKAHLMNTRAAVQAPGQSSGVETRQKKKTGETSVPVDAPDPNLGYFYSDTIPVRSVSVSSMVCARETDPMPYSPQYQVLAGRLNDPAQTGVLSSVVRGPNVRDATTMTSLVKALSLRPSTRYEIAALLRSGAMALSLAEESYSSDPIPYRFVRRMKSIRNIGFDIFPKPGPDPAQWQMTAMPLDTFVALANNSYYPSCVPGFTYSSLDVTWTAVPVPSRLLGQSHLLAYLYAFLTSDAWSGTVSYRTSTQRAGPDNNNYIANETYLPVINNTDIPGVKKACLVLIDETSYNAPSELRMQLREVSVTIPVWKGPTVVASVSSWPLWERFWRVDNIAGIRRDTILAFNEIAGQMGVSDACGTALSILGELYGQWYMGIGPEFADNKPTPDYSTPAYGAWTYDGSALDKTGAFKSNLFNLNQPDKQDARRRCIAYNFSGLTPLHLCPTGLVRTRYIGVLGYLRISWSTQTPEYSVPTYNVQTMTSIMRVATSLGLVITGPSTYKFASPCGFVHWVHMLSCAVSFTTADFLTLDDLTPRDWAGLYNKYDVAHRAMVLDTLKTNIYGGIVVHHDIENLYSNISEWDLDIMADYWLLTPYNNVNWLTFSPVPYHCSKQWVDKMQLTSGIAPKGVTTFRYDSTPYMAMKVNRDGGEHKMGMVSTIDCYRRYPQILVREPGDNFVPTIHWVDNVAGYSNAASGATLLAPLDMYESLTFCANINNVGIPYSDPTEWYIIGSNYEYNDMALAMAKTSPIQWPDPPMLETLWLGAKNYILKPAASALAGFLTGGPTGAAVAGATHIAQQLVADLEKPAATAATTAVAKPVQQQTVEETAKKILGVPVSGTTEKEKLKTDPPTPKPTSPKTKSKTANPDKSSAPMTQGKDGGKENTQSTPDIPVPEPTKSAQATEIGPINE